MQAELLREFGGRGARNSATAGGPPVGGDTDLGAGPTSAGRCRRKGTRPGVRPRAGDGRRRGSSPRPSYGRDGRPGRPVDRPPRGTAARGGGTTHGRGSGLSEGRLRGRPGHGRQARWRGVGGRRRARTRRRGTSCRPGRFRFRSGRATLSMLTGVSLVVEGPADLEFVSYEQGLLPPGQAPGQRSPRGPRGSSSPGRARPCSTWGPSSA